MKQRSDFLLMQLSHQEQYTTTHPDTFILLADELILLLAFI